MAKKAADSSEATSDELKQRLSEQTSELEVTEDEPEQEVQVEAPDVEEEETQTEEAEEKETASEEEETEEESATLPPKKDTLHKLKVLGEEEELPLDRIIALAQVERARELKKEKVEPRERELAERERRLAEREQQLSQPKSSNKEQMDAWVQKKIEEDGLANTLMALSFNAYQVVKNNESEEKKADRDFERACAETDPVAWKVIQPVFRELREEGIPRDLAYERAENRVLKRAILQAKTTGQKEGQNKEKMKLKAQIPTGAKKTRVESGRVPTSEEARKMSSAELKKRISKLGLPFG